jgi:hypothetical protein
MDAGRLIKKTREHVVNILTREQVRACIHPRQHTRFALALLSAILLAPLLIFLIALSSVTLLLPWFLLFVWVSGEVFFAYFAGNSVLVSDMNYPRIQKLTEEVKQSLGVDKKVDIFIFEQGNFNAYMMKLFFRRAIFLNSEILEAGVSDDEVRWIIGRFVGYWRAQRNSGFAGWLIRFARRFLIMNFFLLPYDRAMVYTGDRLALAVIDGDISSGISALQKLLVGRQLGYSVNPIGVVEQSRRIKGSVFAFMARVLTPFPHTIARYVDLIVFAEKTYPRQFSLFAASNPGLPADLKTLGNHGTSIGTVAKALAAVIGILILIALSGAAVALLGSSIPGLKERIEMAFLPKDATNEDVFAPPPADAEQGAPGDVTLKLPNGDVYNGAAANNLPEGNGALTKANGDVATGTFHEGTITDGTYKWADGDSYEGTFADGQPDGDGTLTFADGTTYTGTFVAGQPNGQGTFSYPDGREYTGDVQNGMADGKGTLTAADGSKTTGQWVAGKLKKRGK